MMSSNTDMLVAASSSVEDAVVVVVVFMVVPLIDVDTVPQDGNERVNQQLVEHGGTKEKAHAGWAW